MKLEVRHRFCIGFLLFFFIESKFYKTRNFLYVKGYLYNCGISVKYLIL